MLVCAAARDAQAQRAPVTPAAAADSVSADSLLARLARAEAAIALLRAQMATESQSTVHTRSRIQLELTGRVQTNAFWTSNRVNNVDVPQTALAFADPAPATGAFGMSLRQTRLGASVGVNDVAGATFVADLEADFFGGVQNGPGDRRLFPEPRLRTSRALLRWTRTELMVGSDVPLVSPLNPISVAASGTPGFSAAGNLWNWLPQLRLGQQLVSTTLRGTSVRVGVQAAVMTPIVSAQLPGEVDGVDAGERSRRPAVEARLHAQWGDGTDAGATDASIARFGGEIGVGVHRGSAVTEGGRETTSRALAMDARASFGGRWELRGEAYAGQLLRGLGGGGIGQAFGRPASGALSGPPIRNRAGWAQLNLQALRTVLLGAGCGVDVANQADRPVRTRNTVCAGHALWRPAEPLLLDLEYRRLETRFDAGGLGRAHHLNLTFGVEI